jgi:hypothetical protein
MNQELLSFLQLAANAGSVTAPQFRQDRGIVTELITRQEVARRIGFSRSSLWRYLRHYRDQIPPHLRPDEQAAVNKIPGEFVGWFFAEGRNLRKRQLVG